MQLNGTEFEFDFTDAEDLERFEKAYETLCQSTTPLPQESQSQTIRRQCEATKRFFDNVLGEGAYAKIVEKPTSALENSNAILDFAEAYRAAMDQIEQQQSQRLKKYQKYISTNRRV